MDNYTQDEIAQRAQLKGLCDLLNANNNTPFLLITQDRRYTEVESGVIGRAPSLAGCLMSFPVTQYRRIRIGPDESESEVTTPRAEVVVAPQDSRYLAVGSAIIQALKNMNLGHYVSRFVR